jgi:hypothetical protein
MCPVTLKKKSSCACTCSLGIMAFDWIGPDFVFAGLGTLYTLCGILTMREAAAGFANTGVLTVMALFVVAEGVSQTGGEAGACVWL